MTKLELKTSEISTNHLHLCVAHNILTLVSQTLHTLTKTQNILTILHNTTNSSTTPYPPNPHPPRQTQHAQSLYGKIPYSIFPSSPQKPALGQIFAQFPDIHLFLHALPRGRRDAGILYGAVEGGDDIFDFDGGSDDSEGGVKYVTVIEVLKDEAAILGEDAAGLGGEVGRKQFGYREQKWTAVDVDVDMGVGGGGTGLVCAFGERGG